MIIIWWQWFLAHGKKVFQMSKVRSQRIHLITAFSSGTKRRNWRRNKPTLKKAFKLIALQKILLKRKNTFAIHNAYIHTWSKYNISYKYHWCWDLWFMAKQGSSISCPQWSPTSAIGSAYWSRRKGPPVDGQKSWNHLIQRMFCIK